jgi:hypothetical protein
MKVWVAYLIPTNNNYFDVENLEENGVPFMAASDVGEDEAEGALLRSIMEDYPKDDMIDIYKAHRLHVRMLELPNSREQLCL